MSDLSLIRTNTDLLSLVTTQLKIVSASEGGEWAGPCPFCNGEDRFRVQPFHKDGGRWLCRGCGEGKWHDAIDYVMRRDNVEFQEALRILAPGESASKQKKREPEERQEVDRAKWTEAAGSYITDSIIKLWSDAGARAREYLHARGLTDDTLHHWMIGFNDVDGYDTPANWGLPSGRQMRLYRGITIPCRDEAGLHYIKIRRSSGEPRYPYLTGSKYYLFGAQNLRNTDIAFLLESELDVLLCWQTQFNLGYCSIPANQNIRPDWQLFFDGIEDVIVCHDEDEEGQKSTEKLCKLPHFWRAPHLPMGKDITEYFQAGGDVFEYLFDAVGVIPHGS